MKRITLLAIAAGAIFGSVGAASAQGIYLDLGPDRGPVRTIATTTTAPVTGTGNGTEENGTVIAGTEDIIGLGAIRPLTDAKTAGLCKTVSASRIGATNGPPALRAARWRCLPTLQSQDSDREALGSHVRQHRAAVTSCSARCGRPGARSP